MDRCRPLSYCKTTTSFVSVLVPLTIIRPTKNKKKLRFPVTPITITVEIINVELMEIYTVCKVMDCDTIGTYLCFVLFKTKNFDLQ